MTAPLRLTAFLSAALAMTACSSPPPPAPQAAAPAVQPVIALCTDFGWEDAYVAQIKGAILTIDPEARLLDLTHGAEPFNIAEGAYLLEQSAREFPPGTIFVAVIDPGVGGARDPILVKTNKGKFYLGPDNGLFSRIIAEEGFAAAWKLDRPKYYRAGVPSSTFHGRDIFGPIAARLATGVPPDQLGSLIPSASGLAQAVAKDPIFTGTTLSAEVLHVDHYGNVILNLAADDPPAAHLRQGELVKILLGRETYSAPLVRTYEDVPKGRLLLLYGSSGLLEISMNQGSAARELKVQAGAALLLKP